MHLIPPAARPSVSDDYPPAACTLGAAGEGRTAATGVGHHALIFGRNNRLDRFEFDNTMCFKMARLPKLFALRKNVRLAVGLRCVVLVGSVIAASGVQLCLLDVATGGCRVVPVSLCALFCGCVSC
jgi:hypothetical protein